jgi:hypothetical protein
MKPKLYGIGKCGSRIVFDFSAYTYSHPPAFELRNNNLQAVDQIVGVYQKIQRSVQTTLGQIIWPRVTPVRLYTTYSSVAIDSDSEGNEVIKLQAQIAKKRHAVLPIEKSIPLGRRIGGCAYGVVSEAFAANWISGELPVDLHPDPDSEKFALVATSLGGGTGSGAAAVLANWAARITNKPNRPFHVSIVGILPMTDMDYGDGLTPAWAFGDQINTGRALTLYLSQTAQARRGEAQPGLWLLSNDLLRGKTEQESENNQQPTTDRSISVINYHVAAVACFLSNIAGAPEDSPDSRTRQYVTVEANLDSAEINNQLGGKTYFTAYATEDSTNDIYNRDERGTRFTRTLLRRALSALDLQYAFDKDSAPQGCGLPFPNNELALGDLDSWCQAEGFYQPIHLPVELRTAGWVGVLYGQPEKHRSPLRRAALKQAVREMFPAADIEDYPFYHRFDNSEHLCLFIAGSFVRINYLALVGYCQACFQADGDFLATLDRIFTEGKSEEIDTLTATLMETETYSRDRFGTEAAELTDKPPTAEETGRQQATKPTPRLVRREDVAAALKVMFASFRRPPKSRNVSMLR